MNKYFLGFISSIGCLGLVVAVSFSTFFLSKIMPGIAAFALSLVFFSGLFIFFINFIYKNIIESRGSIPLDLIDSFENKAEFDDAPFNDGNNGNNESNKA